MASIPAPAVVPDIKKLSFAKVAASASKEGGPAVPRAPGLVSGKGPRGSIQADPLPGLAPLQTVEDSIQTDGKPTPPVKPLVTAEPSSEDKVVEGLKDLKLDMKMPSLIVNGGSESTSTEQSSKTGSGQTPSEDASQKADSGSELGTKPPSLDGKSITSGTTFNVLDEKESLRPDDSASVKAAAEEDDSFSIRGSLIANSRMGSDVAGRLRNIQIGDMPPRVITTTALPEAHTQGVATPGSGTSEQQPVANDSVPLAAGNGSQEAFSGFYSQNPDEKLLEAMKTPKDRLFLLRLEKDVIEFVQDSKEPFMDLPPSNSFCRMLTHKLADYYHMTHSFEAVAGAVRIFRTPFCRVPPSLQSIAAANDSASSTPPPALLPRKIMRRGEDSDSAPVSAGPSKPTSEVGSEQKEKTAPPKEKLTREEREEAYNKARLRIFGNSSQTEASSPDNEDSTGVSRASSVSAKDKSNLGKSRKTGKQRRDDSESFDSRSQYTPYWSHPQQPMWAPQQFVAISNGVNPYNSQMQPQPPPQPQPSYINAMPPVYGPPSQVYPTMVPNGGGLVPSFNNPLTTTSSRFPTSGPPQPQMHAAYATPGQGTPPQSWQQQQTFNSQSPYQARVPPTNAGSASSVGAAGIPYAFGQLPVHSNPHDPKSQHPIPGSYNRHAFNPKTQSFVPGGIPAGPAALPGPPVAGPSPVPGPIPVSIPGAGPNHVPYVGPGQPQQQAGTTVVNALSMTYNAYLPSSSMIQPPYGGGSNGSYGMMRQGSNSAVPPYHHLPQQRSVVVAQQHQPQPHQHQHNVPHVPHGPHLPHGPHQHHPHHTHKQSPRIPNKPPMAQPSVATGPTTFSHLPTYGNPISLPQKPST